MTPVEEKELETLLSSCVKGLMELDELAQDLTSNLSAMETVRVMHLKILMFV
jgi:hypothetical protein